MTDKHLALLANAINDVGYWSWWDWTESPEKKLLKLEFGGVQLWSPPYEEGHPPCSLFSLGFYEPTSIIFLNFSEELPTNWKELLKNDELQPFNINRDFFDFNDRVLIEKLNSSSIRSEIYHGVDINDDIFKNSKYIFGFSCYKVGMIIASDQMELYSFNTSKAVKQIDFDEIEQLNAKWWDYWEQYWRLKDSENPLPEDYTCEVTIPAGKFSPDKIFFPE